MNGKFFLICDDTFECIQCKHIPSKKNYMRHEIDKNNTLCIAHTRLLKRKFYTLYVDGV